MPDIELASYQGQQEITEAINNLSLSSVPQKAVWFDNVASMVAYDLPVGVTAATRGYHTVNDGGSAFYYIREVAVGDVEDGGSIIFLDNGNVAELITDGTVTPEQFGAYGDGTHDDTTAITNAINSGYNVYIPKGHYICSSAISNTTGLTMFGEGNESIIDYADSLPSGTGLTISGSLTQIADISDASAGDITVTFVSAHGLSVGDVFCIYNPTNYSWSGFRDYFKAGEWCEVTSVVDSTNVKIASPLYDSYTGASVDVYKLNSVPVSIKNVKLQGTDIYQLLKIDMCKNVVLEKVKAYSEQYLGVLVSRCYNVDINECDVFDLTNTTGGQYGLDINNSQNVYINNGSYFGGRHGIAIGGGQTPCGVVNRHIRVRNAYIDSGYVTVGSADMHGNTEDTYYVNCTIIGGGTFGGKDNGFLGCNVTNNTSGVVIYYYDVKGGTFVIENCKFRSNVNPDTTSRGYIDIGGGGGTINSNSTEDMLFIVHDCEFDLMNVAHVGCPVVKFRNDGSTAKTNFDIDNITFINNVSRVSVLYTRLTAGTENGDYVIVDNIKGLVADSVYGNFQSYSNIGGVSGVYLRGSKLRLPITTGNTTVSITSGDKTALGSQINYTPAAFPRMPSVTVTVAPDSNTLEWGNTLLAAGVYRNWLTYLQPYVYSPTGTAINADKNVTVTWVAQIREI